MLFSFIDKDVAIAMQKRRALDVRDWAEISGPDAQVFAVVPFAGQVEQQLGALRCIMKTQLPYNNINLIWYIYKTIAKF